MQKDQLQKDYGEILLNKFTKKRYEEVIKETEKLILNSTTLILNQPPTK